MRWNKPEPRLETYWNPWFAWRPVQIEDTGQTVWLEWVWRHTDYYGAAGSTFAESRYRSDVHWSGANLEWREPNKIVS